MSFYLLFYQLVEAVNRLESRVKYLIDHALRMSPRDGQANRRVLEECAEKLGDVETLLNFKAHISKVHLRRMAVLFQALETAHRRVLNLAGTAVTEDDALLRALWSLLFQAQKDYQTLRTALTELMGVAVNLDLPQKDADPNGRFTIILQTDFEFQEELIKLIERGIEVFNEDQNLAECLDLVRRNLLESRRTVKRLLATHSVQRELDMFLK